MDGQELCREVRDGDPPEWHTHFVLVTGRDDRNHLVEGLHAGADEFITKPLELEARLEAAWRVLAVHRALEANNFTLRLDSAREHRAARTDPLTAVSNRLRLKEDLEPLEGPVSRYEHRYCAALCDIDAFRMGRVRQEVEKLSIRHAPAGPAPFSTISVGIAELGGGSIDHWLRRADAALYRAKALGRNRVEAEDEASVPPSLRANEVRCPS